MDNNDNLTGKEFRAKCHKQRQAEIKHNAKKRKGNAKYKKDNS